MTNLVQGLSVELATGMVAAVIGKSSFFLNYQQHKSDMHINHFF